MSVPTSRQPALPASGILDVLPVAEAPVAPAPLPPVDALPATGDTAAVADLAPAPRPRAGVLGSLVWFLYGVGRVCEWLFGAVCLMVGLAVLAAVPVLQFLS